MYTALAKPTNYSRIQRNEGQIKYIVIHYTGNDGDTARNNVVYFRENFVGASAHFFIDEKEVCCSVPWYFTAWHCGTKGTYKHAECRNGNSIAIEICSRKKNGVYYFDPEAVERAAEFTAQQMKNYGVSIDRVVRHYDVTGKICPAPFIDKQAWSDFKRLVYRYYQQKVGDGMTYYETIKEVPKGIKRDMVQKLMDRGTIKGDSKGNLHLSDDMVRLMIFLDREGVFK